MALVCKCGDPYCTYKSHRKLWGRKRVKKAELTGKSIRTSADIPDNIWTHASLAYLKGLYYNGNPLALRWAEVTPVELAPPVAVKQATPIVGYRSYDVVQSSEGGPVLKGARQEWVSPKLSASCHLNDDVTLWGIYAWPLGYAEENNLKKLRTVQEERADCLSHLEAGTCACGIYGRKKPEVFSDGCVIARVLAYGKVAEDEDGNWHASDCLIEKLWVVRQKENSQPDAHLGIYYVLDTPQARVKYFQYIDWNRMAWDLSLRYGVSVDVVDDLEEIDA